MVNIYIQKKWAGNFCTYLILISFYTYMYEFDFDSG